MTIEIENDNNIDIQKDIMLNLEVLLKHDRYNNLEMPPLKPAQDLAMFVQLRTHSNLNFTLTYKEYRNQPEIKIDYEKNKL